VRSSGYFNAKARKLKAFAAHVMDNYQGDLDLFLTKPLAPLREELLSIYGIGEETADDIMVYAARQPSFVIDTYTRRIMDRMGIPLDTARSKYADYQTVFHTHIPQDIQLYNEFHALWDRHAKEACTKLRPRCEDCCLLDICPTGHQLKADR
jgi:endonuclease-3 related protein